MNDVTTLTLTATVRADGTLAFEQPLPLPPGSVRVTIHPRPLTQAQKFNEAIDRIRDFETVLNGRYPTATDVRLSSAQRATMRTLSAVRYRTGFNKWPYEIKALQKLWSYRQPEIEGFASK